MNQQLFFMMVLITYFTLFQISAEGNMSYYSMAKNTHYGNQVYGKESVEEIQGNGFVKLSGTTVSEHLQVNGRLTADDAQINEMQVNGQASLNQCLVKQKSLVCGALNATSSTFADELSVSSEKVSFYSCNLTSLHILRVGGYEGIQVVEVKGKTKIDGAIKFDSGHGEVIADSNVEITGGIIGGTLRK